MTVVAVIQARVGSTRLPGKVLLPLAGAPALQRMIERLSSSRRVDRIVVATSISGGDDAVADLCGRIGVACGRGPELDVLSRFAAVADTSAADADLLVRLTGDCPLVAPDVVDAVIVAAVEGGFDYVSNTEPPTWPDGLDVEVMTRDALIMGHRAAVVPSDREHVTPWLRRELRSLTTAAPSSVDLSRLRWTLDEPEDYVLIAAIYAALHDDATTFTTADVLGYLQSRPELGRINEKFGRNEGYRRSLLADDPAGAPHDTA